jgi:hypothetical protein
MSKKDSLYTFILFAALSGLVAGIGHAADGKVPGWALMVFAAAGIAIAWRGLRDQKER